MGVLDYGENIEDDKYVFYRKAGRSIIERRPTFSPDGESIAVIVEDKVRVYNIQTGDCVRTLEAESPVKDLIAIHFPKNENYNLVGCSSAGDVITWTWINGIVLRELKLKIPVCSKILTFDLVDNTECFVTTTALKQKFISMFTFSLKNGLINREYISTERSPLKSKVARVALGWCDGDRFAALTNGTKYLYIQNLRKHHVRTVITNHNGYRIMSVAAHSTANVIAITDTLGRTTLIRGNLFDYKQVGREVLHWHYLPTLDVSFSLQGTYVYTGGMENVLVKWTVGSLAYKAYEKSFIPRLPGIIRYIATNNTHVAVTLANNSIVIANVQLRVVSTILECGGLSPVVRAIGGTLLYHQPANALITAGRSGHLQLYSTNTDKVLFSLDITEMNRLPAERWNLMPKETEVTCAAIDGKWLVTSEYRNDGVLYTEEQLKFWREYPKTSTPYRLNTCVNLSHGGCNVVSLAFNKGAEFCVSAGTDQKFRIWKRENISTTPIKQFSWFCLTACYYSSGIGQFLSSGVFNNFKDDTGLPSGKDEDLPYLKEVDNPESDVIMKLFDFHKENPLVEDSLLVKDDDECSMGGVAITPDGSLIAAWFGCKLTLWDTHMLTLRTSLSHPALRPKGVQAQFGSWDAAHYLVCTTEECLAVWSLLSLTVKWIVKIHPTCLTKHRLSNRMAVTTANNDVYVFRPTSSKPVLTKQRLLDPSTGLFKQCVFGNCQGSDNRLYLMRNNSEIYCVEPKQTEKSRLEVISAKNLPTSKFSALLAEQQVSEVQTGISADVSAVDVNAIASSAVAQFSLTAPHMVPPMSLLCTSFLQRLSGQPDQPDEVEDAEEQKPMDVDLDSSDDEDLTSKLNGPHAPKVTELWTANYEAVKEKKLNKIMNNPFLDTNSSSALFGM